MRIVKAADVDGPAVITGGMNAFMTESADALRAAGHDVQFLFREDMAPRVRPDGIRRLVAPWTLWWKLWRRQQRGDRADVVEIHEPLASAYCLMRRLQRRLPPCVVISYGAQEDRWRAQRERWRATGQRPSRKSRVTVPLTLVPQSRYALTHADHVLVPSEWEDAYLRDRLRVPPGRRTRIDPGVGPAYFALPRRPYDGGGLRVLFVGTWIDRKGTPEIVESWSRLAARHPDMQLTVSCTVRSRSEVLARFNGFSDRVAVEPRATEAELLRLLAEHHVFVLPAWFEGGMPLATLQAAAAGLPCVVTRIGGHVELFRAGDPERDGGLLVPPHDENAVAEAVARLAGDPALLDRLGENARRRARSFTWEATAEACLAAYRNATAPAGRAPSTR